jgi:beta-glucosidase
MVTYAQTPDSANDSPEHRDLAHQLARETMVMLKNDGTLPLNPAIKNILVVGPLADNTRVLEGNYHGTASHYTTALDGIRQQFPGAHITFEPGTTFLRKPPAPEGKPAPTPKEDTEALDRAIAAAKSADVIIGIVGITSDLEGEEMKVDVPGFLGGDRTSLDLPQPEEQLMEYMHASGKPLIAVLMNGSALSVNWLSTHANAILDAWYPGEEGGAAIAETLSGLNNPAGKLPVTVYTGVSQLPDFTNYSMEDRTYRYFTGTPLYPFGYGLSYSKFTFTNLKLSQLTLKAGVPLEVSVDVTNTSGPDGDEVVELYITPPQTLGNPLHALRAFQRIHLAKGATEPVKLSLTPRDLSFVDLAGDRYIHAGTYQITAGDGQPKAPAASTTETTLTITGDEKLPE